MEAAFMHFPGGRDLRVRRGGLERKVAGPASQLDSMERP
jgi:hypothetical protein